jgi:L-ascorbate metabolism protein UlaG (beta-lactamase superfamily)
MRISRKRFLLNSAKLTAGTVLFAPFLKFQQTKAEELSPPDTVPDPSLWKNDEINIAWIGHSTVLMNLYGTVIVTDPVLFERIGLYFLGTTIGQSRYTMPALEFDKFPCPDLILLSHAHMDHMDTKTLLGFTDKFPNKIDCITAYNTSDVISDMKWRSLRELDWNQKFESDGLKLTAIEVKHFGWRLPWERDRSRGYFNNGRSYNAYLIEKGGKKIVFGGDTALTNKFFPYNNVDIAIMPIGAYNPWKTNHSNPEEALKMASDDLRASVFIPIHCNTFKQGLEPIDEPLRWLQTSVRNYDIKLGLKKIGETFTLKL